LEFSFSFEANDDYLHQILELQRKNLKINLSPLEIVNEGFVTLQYRFDVLKKLHEETPHLVVHTDDKVIGYALAMPRHYGHIFPELDSMFQTIDGELLKKLPALSAEYLVMGQICIAKEFRGMGLFQQIYDVYLKKYKAQFGYVVTEIARMNARSLTAHKKVGFQEVATHTEDDGVEWIICII
jgi:L-amino acid N-acyltransferase YncA